MIVYPILILTKYQTASSMFTNPIDGIDLKIVSYLSVLRDKEEGLNSKFFWRWKVKIAFAKIPDCFGGSVLVADRDYANVDVLHRSE